MAKTFYLNRKTDITGVSGTGRVAQGIEFDNGKVAITWLTGVATVTVYDSIADVEKINGHGGHTTIDFDKPTKVSEFLDAMTRAV